MASGASKLGPSNPELVRTVRRRRAAVAAFDGGTPGGRVGGRRHRLRVRLDPHVSPDYAYQQVNRVAKTRGPKPATVRCRVAGHVRDRVLGFLGQERVTVVELNSALADRT
ncbi:potassium-transporting ATPase subunit C [Streptomyces sp. NPDC094472]|uniref:potassium-transporting ATPase subunit C n=1 Tax=unclassified Streptomyces TaxID=2593676 RepID=UPI003324EE37